MLLKLLLQIFGSVLEISNYEHGGYILLLIYYREIDYYLTSETMRQIGFSRKIYYNSNIYISL